METNSTQVTEQLSDESETAEGEMRENADVLNDRVKELEQAEKAIKPKGSFGPDAQALKAALKQSGEAQSGAADGLTETAVDRRDANADAARKDDQGRKAINANLKR